MVQNRQKVKVNPFTLQNVKVNPFTFFFMGGGAIFKVNFLDNYTSNEAQTKLKMLSMA